MLPTPSTLLTTMTGKVALGVAVATMAVGGVAAAGGGGLSVFSGPEDPTLEQGSKYDDDQGDDEDDEGTEESSEATDEETEEGRSEESEEERGEPTQEPSGETSAALQVEDEGTPAGDEDEESNHGAVVSEFTQNIDLEGCAKGQATAAVARGDVSHEGALALLEMDPDALAAALHDYIGKCDRNDEGTENEPESEQESEESADWKDTRDENQAAWLDAKDEWVAVCGDDEESEGDETTGAVAEDPDGADGTELDCKALKRELQAEHERLKAEWKDERDAAKDARADARDAEKAERKAARAEAKSERSNGGQGKAKKDR